MNWQNVLGFAGLAGLLFLIWFGFRQGMSRKSNPNHDNWSADPRDPTP
jgi:threonine/homoserine/homoserine lactone efflux protein